jgi:nicotinate-nucleotide pyrophosphorylase (carboxylating)
VRFIEPPQIGRPQAQHIRMMTAKASEAGQYPRPRMTETAVAEIVARALAEDVGSGDLTSLATVPEAARAHAVITQKAPGVVFGLDAAEATFRTLDPDVGLQRLTDEGRWRECGGVLQIEGSARALLTAERTALNFLQRLSGVATLAARCVEAVEGTGARILDTRKTTPGLRWLEKAAVAAGGATNHRAGLYDAILIKENHATLAGGVGEAVRRARAYAPSVPIEVECRTLTEVDEALRAGAPRILLDNMTVEQLRDAVRHVDGRAELEASGGVTLRTLRAIASTGVDFISVGALTHSAPALDLSLLLEPIQ